MNEIILMSTKLEGGSQTAAKTIIIVCICLWLGLIIINKIRGDKE